MAINIGNLVNQNYATFKLHDFIEIYNVVVFYDCYIYFNDIDGACKSNSLFKSITLTTPLMEVVINRDFGTPVLIGLWKAGSYNFNIPIVTSSFQIGKQNSSPNVVLFYKNYKP